MTDREPPPEPAAAAQDPPSPGSPAPPPVPAAAPAPPTLAVGDDDTLQGPLRRLGGRVSRDLARQTVLASVSAGLFGPAAAPAAPRLGAYTLERMLGHGGMGVVHRACGPRGEQVAIKTLRAIDPAAIEQLKHEFRSVADLHHPNLVALHELGHHAGPGGDEWFIVMELVPGVAFDQRLHPPVDEAALRDATIQLVRGLHTLHRAGRLHRDLKPSNVLITADDRVVILDFGLAHAHAEAPTEARAGTPAYMSPEQARGEPLTPASDWYSLGLLLHLALTGGLPGHADPRTRPAPPPPAAASPALAALCVALLDPDPRARPDARAIARALARDLDDDVPADQVPLLGRGRELAAISELARRAPHDAAAILLEGRSGVGKSALLAAFLHTRSAAGELVLRARCYEHESVPYKAVDALVDALTTHLRSWPPADLAAILPADFAALTRVFPVLARLAAPAAPDPSPPPDPQELRRLAFRALRSLLAAVARTRPLVLAIDDLQWGDLDSARLLLALLAPPDPLPCLWIGTCRSEDRDTSPFLAELARGGLVPRTQSLAALPPDDAAELARALLHARGDPPDAALVAAVARESEGSPLFVEALIRQHSGRELPISLDHALLAALERVDPPAQRLLHLCAVAGQPLARPLLVAAGLGVAVERAALQQLRARHLLRSTGDQLVPYHDRIREVVLRNLPSPALRDLHRRLADALERHDPDPERLAFHFHAAADDHRAAPYAAIAADRAADALAFDRAATLYAQALAWTPDPRHHLALTLRHADSLVHAGRCGDAAPRYLAAAALVAAEPPTGDPTTHLRALELRRKAAEQYLVSGRVLDGLAVLRPLARDQGLPFPETPNRAKLRLVLDSARFTLRGIHFSPPTAPLAPADALRLETCWSAAKGLSFIDPLRAATFAGEHLRRCLAHGEPGRVARALAHYALLDVNIGSPRKAARGQARIDRAHHLAQGTGDPLLIGITTIIRGVADLNCGRWRRAVARVEAGIDRLGERRLGVTWERSIARAMAMHALVMLGDWPALGPRAAAWLREAEELGDRFACVVAGLYVGHARLADADLAGARQAAATARALWSADGVVDGFHFQHWLALGLEVACELADARPHAAWQRVSAAWPAIRTSDLLRIQVPRIDTLGMRAHAALALAHVSSDRSSLLRTAAALAASLAREPLVHARAAAAALQAGVAELRGERPAARRGFARATELFHASDMPVHAACVRRRLAALDGPRALRDVDDSLRARGVRDPASFAAIHVAGA